MENAIKQRKVVLRKINRHKNSLIIRNGVQLRYITSPKKRNSNIMSLCIANSVFTFRDYTVCIYV